MTKMRITLLIFLSGAFILAGCTKEKNTAKSMEQLYKENGVPVKVDTVVKKTMSNTYTSHAVLSGIKESTASAKLADEVDKSYFAVGDVVDKDAVVVSFPKDNPAAQYNQARVAFEHAEATMKRMKNLYENGGISLQDFENADTQYKVAKANWQSVQQTVNVKAPIRGTITQINVQESDNVHPGDELFTISQTNRLKAKIWVAEKQIADIQKGASAVASWSGQSIMGRVAQVDMSLDQNSQSFGVVVEFDNGAGKIRSGANAEIKINSRNSIQAIFINRKNILKQGDEDVVFVATNGAAQKRPVELGRMIGLEVEVLSGLEEGEALITKGQLLLADGAKIRLVN